VLAAASMACAAILFAGAHLATTTIYDLLGWTLLSWLVIRALRDGGPAWLLVGVTLGVALENKSLVLLLAAALLVGIVVAGPVKSWPPAGRGSPPSSPWRCGHRTSGGRPPTGFPSWR